MTPWEPLHAAPRPCVTCPYRRDTPPGLWSADEYRKLATFDPHPGEPATIGVFHCHQENVTGVPTVCRGWLSVHDDSTAVRFATVMGAVTPEQVVAPVDVELYATGQEACDAGLAGVTNPSPEARAAVEKLVNRGAGVIFDGDQAPPAERKSSYAWLITADRYDGSDTGVCGPRDASDEQIRQLKAGKGVAFQMWTDDDEDGVIYEGLYLGPDDERMFRPLDDFGGPNFGCAWIKYRNNGRWEKL